MKKHTRKSVGAGFPRPIAMIFAPNVGSMLLRGALMLICIAFCLTAINCGNGGVPTITSASSPATAPPAVIAPPVVIAAAPAADVTIPSVTGEAPFVLGASIVVNSTSAGSARRGDPLGRPTSVEANRIAAASNKSDVECRIKTRKHSDSSLKHTAWFPCYDIAAMKAQALTEGVYDFVVQSRSKGGNNTTDITETESTEITVTADVAVDGNAKPAIGAITCDSASVEVGAKLTCSAASHADSDTADSQSCKVDWGDGNVDTYPAPCSTEQVHVYADDGSFTITVFGTDGKDASNVETLDITVTEPVTPLTLKAPAWTTTITETINENFAIAGTKPAGSAIYSNGIEIVPADGLTTWTHAFPLSSELNTFVLVAIMPDGSKSLPEELTIPRIMAPAEPILAPDAVTLTDVATQTIYVYAPASADLYYTVNGGGKIKVKDAKSVFDKSQMEKVAFSTELPADATSTYVFTAEDPSSSLTSDPGTTWTVRHKTKKFYSTITSSCGTFEYNGYGEEVFTWDANPEPFAPNVNFLAYSTLYNEDEFEITFLCSEKCESINSCRAYYGSGTPQSDLFANCNAGSIVHKFMMGVATDVTLRIKYAQNKACDYRLGVY